MDMATVVTDSATGISTPTSEGLPPNIAILIEEVGAMQWKADAVARRIKKLQEQIKPHSDKVKQLAALITDYAEHKGIDPDHVFTGASGNFVVLVGKAGTSRRVVDVELAMKMIGKKAFFEKCAVPLAVIDEYLTPGERQRVLKVSRCARGVKVVQRLGPKP